MAVKSEKLKKLETELQDLERWLELGLVPKKDQAKHQEEINTVRSKVEEEHERLRFLKEHGDLEEYVAPKRQPGKTVYQTEMPTIPDVDYGEQATGGFEGNTQYGNTQADAEDEEETETATATETQSDETESDDTADKDDEDEESYFSDRARWKRGGIIDPEADDW